MILKLLEEVCHKLEKINIPYMLSGSLAMSVYTVPRMTRDIDIVIQLVIGDIDEFAELFSEGFYLHKEGIEQEIRSEGKECLMLLIINPVIKLILSSEKTLSFTFMNLSEEPEQKHLVLRPGLFLLKI